MRRTYKSFDTNNDGTLTRDELRGVIKRVITKISDAEIENLLNRLDRNGDNKIDFEGIILIHKNFRILIHINWF